MHDTRKTQLLAGSVLLGYCAVMLGLSSSLGPPSAAPAQAQVAPQQTAFNRPTTSSPLALSADDTLLLSVNPDDDSLSIINTATSALATSNLRVGEEPQAVAIEPAGRFAFVANAASNTVSVVEIDKTPAVRATLRQTLLTGAEPWSVVVSPDGKRVFVANAAQDTITVINNEVNPKTIIGDINLRASSCNVGDQQRHFQPRGLAVTQDNTRLYVARFFSFTKEGGRQADDQGKEGVVCQISINTAASAIAGYSVVGPIALAPRDTGFASPAGAATFAYPNQLQSIVIRGNQAYLPNIAASPSGPLRFNVDTHAFVNVIDNAATGVPSDSNKAINLHLGARTPEQGKKKLFANAWAIGFTSQSGAGTAYAVSAGSDLLVKLNVDATGALSFTGGPATTRYIDLNDPASPNTSGASAGKNPLGIAISANGQRAYVMNFVSRNVSVVDLTSDSVVGTIRTTELPPAGTLDETLLAGAEVFFSSRGHFDGGKSERLSSEGWQNCASCHFQGLSDGNVWAFGTGPRKSVQMNGTWDPRNPDDQRVLNYSAIFDEVQDFEINIRNVSGPGFLDPPTNTLLDPNHGLLVGDAGDINLAPSVVNAFARANGGRPQLSITLPGAGRQPIPALDAMKEWVRFNIRTPNGPLPASQLGAGRAGPSASDIRDGRLIFNQAGCASCHGGGKWTSSTKDFTSPPPATEGFTITERTPLVAGTNPIGAQYLDRFLVDIGSFNLNVPGQGNLIPNTPAIGGVEKTDNGNNDALGKDFNGDGRGAGYNVPSILGAFASPPYYHNGACETLACVLENVRHRTAGLPSGRPDPLASAQSRQKLLAFLESIDVDSQPAINLSIRSHDIASEPLGLFVGTPVTLTANVKLFGPRLLSFPDGPISVSFFNGNPEQGGVKIGDATISSIAQDNGQATVGVPFTPPSQPGSLRIFVVVDSGNSFPEAQERDNVASREFRVRALPADRTRPVVSNVRINDDAVATSERSVTISFAVSDPAGPAPEPASGVREVCVTSYRFNSRSREWDPSACTFRPLSGTGPFSVSETLPETDGAVYAVVVVRDAAGNLSQAQLDFINLVPAGDIKLDRLRDRRIFRVRLNAGQSLRFSADVKQGDVDVAAFRDGERVAVSAQAGGADESITISASADNTVFHIEVEAFARDSAFAVSFGSGSPAIQAEAAQAETITAGREPTEEPISVQPPALLAAFDAADEQQPEEGGLFLPFIAR